MKSNKKLQKILDETKNLDSYYSLKIFKDDAKDFLRDIKKNKIICSMKISKSGMNRRFNFDKYNTLLNICYNKKLNHKEVNVNGCGMDMYWHLLFRACEELATKGELEKYNLNSKCSYQKII